MPDDVIECPSPMRYLIPTIPISSALGGYHLVQGKWGTHMQECDRNFFPDYCTGWAYTMTPRLGLRLAEVAANVDHR